MWIRNRHEQHRKGKDPVLLVVTAGTQPKTKEQAQIDEERIEKAKHPNRQKTKKTADGRVIDGEEDTGEVCEVFESPFWYRTARGLPHSTKLKVRQQPRPDAKVLGVVPEGHAVRCIAGGGDWLMCSFSKVDNAWILCRTGKREIAAEAQASVEAAVAAEPGPEKKKSRFGFGSKKS